jgi:signal transduction histidine kinase/ABC-type multidrug transport system ATPase subunit
VLVVSGLVLDYGPHRVLDGVDLEVRAGEVVALVGENGTGKTTLVRCVGGMLRPSAGTITTSAPGGVAIVWQDLALCDNLDAVANVFLGREQRFPNEPGMEADTRRLLDRFGVAVTDLRQPVGLLSGGQRQVVAVARATAGRPGLLVLDEPTSALGISAARRVDALVQELRAGGTAVLLVSHRVEQVFDLADRILVLRQGKVVAETTPVEAHPDEVAALMEGVEVESTARRQLRRLRGLVDQLAGVEPSSSLPIIVSAAAAALGVGQLSVHLLSGPEPRRLKRFAAVGLAEPLLAAIEDLPVGAGGGPVGLAAESGTMVVVEDTATSPAWTPFAPLGASAGARSCWAAPILGDAGLLGVVSGFGTGVGRPRADLMELVFLYAGYAAAAIERGRLLAEVTRRNRVLETLRSMLETLAGPDRLRGGLEVALLALCRGLAADAAILHVDGDGATDVAPGGGAGAPADAAMSRQAKSHEDRPRAEVVLMVDPDGAERARAALAGASRAMLSAAEGRGRPGLDEGVAAVGLALPDGPAVLAAYWADERERGPEAMDLLADAARSLRLAIEREDLEDAQREADALRRSHGLQRLFLSRVSHELRTPLTAIHGYASSLRQTDVTWDPESEDRFLSAIASESARMSRLVADLLDSSAIESGVLRLNPDWCDLPLVLRAALGCLSPEQAAAVDLSWDPALPPVWGDHDRLEQVFVNLMENGLRHTAPGTRVRVHAGLGRRPGTVAVAVADDGPGIPPEEAERLFQPWERGRTEGPGAGLGLSIVRGIVEGHRGAVGLEPSTGGASFVVELPVDPAEGPEPDGAPARLAGVKELEGERWPR